MNCLKNLSPGLFVLTLLVFASTAWAQNPQGQTPEPNGSQRPFGRGEGRGFRHGHGVFGPGVLRELNLTDDQKQQVRSLIEQSIESTKAQREELRQLGEKRSQGTLSTDDEARAKTLHEQMRASMKDTETKISAILTAEQRARLKEVMKERQANPERFGKHRGGFPGRQGQSGPPQQP